MVVTEELRMTDELLTVGQVARAFGVTVRTLHHYDEVGLVVPSERSVAGYRLYTSTDLHRLQHVVVYRRLGFPLDQIGALLADGADVVEHLRRQRSAVTDRVAELTELVAAIDRALEDEMTGHQIPTHELRELFGGAFDDTYAAEAEERWGGTDIWEQSQERASGYTREQWLRIKQETDEVNGRYLALREAGVPADSEEAMDVAEEARQLISRWFYDCSAQVHAGIAELYVTDERYAEPFEALAPGLATYVRDAMRANAARH